MIVLRPEFARATRDFQERPVEPQPVDNPCEGSPAVCRAVAIFLDAVAEKEPGFTDLDDSIVCALQARIESLTMRALAGKRAEPAPRKRRRVGPAAKRASA